jgi:hypothetical protein
MQDAEAHWRAIVKRFNPSAELLFGYAAGVQPTGNRRTEHVALHTRFDTRCTSRLTSSIRRWHRRRGVGLAP